MTRINVVNPKHLSDEWLIAEFRELPRIPNEIISGRAILDLKKIPKQYLLGTGHVTFFRNKLQYLKNRHDLIVQELLERKFNIDPAIRVHQEEINKLPSVLLGDFVPTIRDVEINIERLRERYLKSTKQYHYKREIMDMSVLNALFDLMRSEVL